MERSLSPDDLCLLTLALLASGERRAREVERDLRARTELEVASSELTATLRRLEREGAVLGRWDEPARGPARKVFLLTEAGQKELDRRRSAWWRFAAAVEATLEGAS